MDMVEDRDLAQYSITKTTTPLCHSAELFNRFPHQSARRRAESLTEYLLEHIPAVVFRGVVCAAFLTLAPNTLIVSNNLLRSAGSSFESETKITGEIFFWWGVRLWYHLRVCHRTYSGCNIEVVTSASLFIHADVPSHLPE